ncbi:MAG: hypothetical protein ACJAS2_001821 [Pseudohongiellaceae bacterium]
MSSLNLTSATGNKKAQWSLSLLVKRMPQLRHALTAVDHGWGRFFSGLAKMKLLTLTL